jgi:5-methylcytosine-specific restriction enzyme A
MSLLELHIRKPLTDLQRAKMFRDHNGICCICETKIKANEAWIDEHERALALGGSNDPDNRGPAHKACAKIKTKDDMRMIAKAKRNEARNIGAARPKHKWGKQPFRREKFDNTKQSSVRF